MGLLNYVFNNVAFLLPRRTVVLVYFTGRKATMR